jgi:chromosome segregation ATPase
VIDAQDEIGNLQNHIEVLSGRIEKLQSDKEGAEQVANIFQADLAKKDAVIKEYYENLKLFNTDLCNKNAKISKLQMCNETLKKQIELLTEKERKLRDQLSELQTAVYDWGETEDIING